MPVQIADFPSIPADPGKRDVYKGIDVIWHNPCGVEVLNVDLRKELDETTFESVLDVWHRGQVIVFRDQKIEAEDQLRFGRRIGELAGTHTHRFEGENPAIMYISNEKKDGKYVHALPVGEMMFHIDQCHQERPAKATMLFAIKIPSEGGNTMFCDLYRAYETLPEDLKKKVAGKKGLNIYDYDAGATQRAAAVSDDAPRCAHPIVRTHPVTGRKALFVNRLMTRGIEGMADDEALPILNRLFDHMENPEFVYEHRWRLGDVLMWDNRCTSHARRDFDPEQPRLMRRLTIKGEKPV
jgi:taurine dioxygenase